MWYTALTDYLNYILRPKVGHYLEDYREDYSRDKGLGDEGKDYGVTKSELA